jgi:crotonyl-CoA reductase
MKSILEAIENNADTKAFAALQIPESYRAAVVRKDEQEMFAGVASADKDPRKSVHRRHGQQYQFQYGVVEHL